MIYTYKTEVAKYFTCNLSSSLFSIHMAIELDQILEKIKDKQIFDNIAIITENSSEVIKYIPDNTFQTCITSPPYWGLRDYGVEKQIGAENSLNDYITNLVNIFREVKRTLKNNGTLWLNIGDSYTSGNRTWRDSDKKNAGRAMSYRPPTPKGLKPKDLIGVPWRLAFALQDDGWFLRSDIIWYKPNCQPESVKDRPTRSHEYLFLLSKSKKYLYNHENLKELASDKKNYRNKRTVWQINTEPFKGSHFAVFPKELVETCLLASTDEESILLDPFLGSGTVAEVSRLYNRRCVGIEINPMYIDLAKKRIKNNQQYSLFKNSKLKIPK